MGERWYSKNDLQLFLIMAGCGAVGLAPAIALLIFIPHDKLFPVYNGELPRGYWIGLGAKKSAK
jgi:hypothetical protein